jgi:hypothetical protein
MECQWMNDQRIIMNESMTIEISQVKSDHEVCVEGFAAGADAFTDRRSK